jgi:hypothetical protein
MKELDENAIYTDPRDKDNTMNTTDVRWYGSMRLIVLF